MTEWADADLELLASVIAARSMDPDADPLLADLLVELRERHRGRRGGGAIARRQQRVAELCRAGFSAPEICLLLVEDVKLRTVEADLSVLRDVLGERGASRRREGLRLAA